MSYSKNILLFIIYILFYNQHAYTFKNPIDINIRCNETDINFGSSKAPIIITEYISYDCYFCQQYILNTFPKINELIKQGKIWYIIKPEIAFSSALHLVNTSYYLFLNHTINTEEDIKMRALNFHKYRHQIMTKKLPLGEANKKQLLQAMNIPEDKFNIFTDTYEKIIIKKYLTMKKKINFSPALIITANGRSHVTSAKYIYDIIMQELSQLKQL